MLLKGLPVTAHPEGACSTFAATSPDGDFMLGRNFDYKPSVLKKKNAVMTEEESMGLLKEAFLDGHKIYKDPSHMYYNSRTQWSAVYNLSAGAVMLCIGDDYERKYRYDFT